MRRKSALIRFTHRSTLSSKFVARGVACERRTIGMTSDEGSHRFLSSSADVADGCLRGYSGHSRVATDHLALHRPYPKLHLDGGAVAFPVHLDGDARRDDWHSRRYAL